MEPIAETQRITQVDKTPRPEKNVPTSINRTSVSLVYSRCYNQNKFDHCINWLHFVGNDLAKVLFCKTQAFFRHELKHENEPGV